MLFPILPLPQDSNLAALFSYLARGFFWDGFPVQLMQFSPNGSKQEMFAARRALCCAMSFVFAAEPAAQNITALDIHVTLLGALSTHTHKKKERKKQHTHTHTPKKEEEERSSSNLWPC